MRRSNAFSAPRMSPRPSAMPPLLICVRPSAAAAGPPSAPLELHHAPRAPCAKEALRPGLRASRCAQRLRKARSYDFVLARTVLAQHLLQLLHRHGRLQAMLAPAPINGPSPTRPQTHIPCWPLGPHVRDRFLREGVVRLARDLLSDRFDVDRMVAWLSLRFRSSVDLFASGSAAGLAAFSH